MANWTSNAKCEQHCSILMTCPLPHNGTNEEIFPSLSHCQSSLGLCTWKINLWRSTTDGLSINLPLKALLSHRLRPSHSIPLTTQGLCNSLQLMRSLFAATNYYSSSSEGFRMVIRCVLLVSCIHYRSLNLLAWSFFQSLGQSGQIFN